MKRFLILLMLAIAPALAQVTLVGGRCDHLDSKSTVPKLIPDSAEDVVSHTSFVEEIVLTNPTAGDVVVTISDKQVVPVEILKVTVPATGIVHSRFSCLYAPGGIRWVAATASAVAGRVKIRD